MKILILITIVFSLLGCGYASRDNETIGQVKKVVKATPLICPNRNDIDMSLGVMKNGVGSMSTQDLWFTVNDPLVYATLKSANESGGIVKINYNTHRLTICQEPHEITKAEVLK